MPRKRRPINRKPVLTIPSILRDADAFHRRHGYWPKMSHNLEWRRIDNALRHGFFGLPGGSSLARLLAERRGVRNVHDLPRLTVAKILAWADEQRQQKGTWPTQVCGAVLGRPGETWAAIDRALRAGVRGLPGRMSLARVLNRHRRVPIHGDRPRLTVAQILRWADRHQEMTGLWPTTSSGPVLDAPGETWLAVGMALIKGHRGLPGGISLAQLLAKRRGVRNARALSKLSVGTILAWVDEHHQQTGAWPKADSGAVSGHPTDTWLAVDIALRQGHRGLRGGSSLARVLAKHRGHTPRIGRKPHTEERILIWADRHRRRTGVWPTSKSGPVADAPGETWNGIERALTSGLRGLPGGSSLAQLLQERHGVPRWFRKDGRRMA